MPSPLPLVMWLSQHSGAFNKEDIYYIPPVTDTALRIFLHGTHTHRIY
jgi:hypothetical protein